MNQNTQGLVGGGVVAVIALGFAGWFAYDQSTKNATAKAFEERITDYTTMPAAPAGNFTSGTAKPKMVTIDWQQRKLDWLYFDLPKDLRAKDPDEVETVVHLKWTEEKEDEYEGGGYAYRWHCLVTVYDIESKKCLSQMKYVGGAPPQVTNTPAGSNDYGSKPTGEIVGFLKSLAGR